MAHAKLSILVIDDDKGDRAFCRRTLARTWGDALTFAEAESGASGLEAIEKSIPDCVLLDHSLPGIDGIEVLRRLRIKHPYLPVVMIDGKGNDAVAVQSMKDGAQDYVAKNAITPPVLQRMVEMAIEHARLQKSTNAQRASLEIFTRALAHDLKEPLRTVNSYLDVIPDFGSLSEQSQKSLQYIRQAAHRMTELVDMVHLYTRLDAVEPMETTTCDISGVVTAVLENLAQLIAERGAIVGYETLPHVSANRVQMVQLFQNLISNAIKHSEWPVTIHIGATSSDGHWNFEVRDDGPGIVADNVEIIFDPFKRLSHGARARSGSGLGLAICRKIVESHGGKIWCQSAARHGSSFLFTLPRAAEVTRPLARILFVDDNPADIELNQILLIERSKLRCEILVARDGQEALAVLGKAAEENNRIDLALVDINMPVMNGFELLIEMNRTQMLTHTDVIMCTTSNYDKDQQTAKSLGAIGYLTKAPQFVLFRDIVDRCQKLNLSKEGEGFALRRRVRDAPQAEI